ncbi:hypothetical protein LDENG_00195820, partial [Lucifuga dentata]
PTGYRKVVYVTIGFQFKNRDHEDERITKATLFISILTSEDTPNIFFVKWNRMISRFIWGGRKPRVKCEMLQLPKEDGGMALPKIEYYISAQLRYIYCWCNPNYKQRGKIWKRN